MGNTFEEPYLIKYSYISESGAMKFRQEDICVTVVHGKNEKNNHDKAEKAFISKNKSLRNLKVNSVIYV